MNSEKYKIPEEHLDYLYEREIHEVDEEELNFPEDNFDLERWQ